MLNRNSAITEKYNIGKYPFEDNIVIIFSENRNLIIQQIAAWPEEMSNIETFFSDQLGVQKNIDFNKGEILKDNSLWRMEPSKWWLLGSAIEVPENLGTSLELSHAFTSLTTTLPAATIAPLFTVTPNAINALAKTQAPLLILIGLEINSLEALSIL